VSVRHLIQETAGLINAARSVAPIVAVLSEDEARDGVTTVSCGLAAELVAMRRSVAVVDFDFTDPQLHERLEQPLGLGLAAVLAGDARIDHVFNYSSITGSKFLAVTAGEHHVRRAPLLSAPTATQAVQRLSELADIVLLIGAPLTTQAGQDLVALVDSVILIVDAQPPLGPEQRPAILRGSRPYVAARVADPGAVMRPRDETSRSLELPSPRSIPARVVPARRSTDPVPAPPSRRNGSTVAAEGTDRSGRTTRRHSTRTGASSLAWPVVSSPDGGQATEPSLLPAVFVDSTDLPGFEEPSDSSAPTEEEAVAGRKRLFRRSTKGRYLD